jgi:hypothetical protein
LLVGFLVFPDAITERQLVTFGTFCGFGGTSRDTSTTFFGAGAGVVAFGTFCGFGGTSRDTSTTFFGAGAGVVAFGTEGVTGAATIVFFFCNRRRRNLFFFLPMGKSPLYK